MRKSGRQPKPVQAYVAGPASFRGGGDFTSGAVRPGSAKKDSSPQAVFKALDVAPQDLVGRRVEVNWNRAGPFLGRVAAYNSTGEFEIKYDDGDSEWGLFGLKVFKTSKHKRPYVFVEADVPQPAGVPSTSPARPQLSTPSQHLQEQPAVSTRKEASPTVPAATRGPAEASKHATEVGLDSSNQPASPPASKPTTGAVAIMRSPGGADKHAALDSSNQPADSSTQAADCQPGADGVQPATSPASSSPAIAEASIPTAPGASVEAGITAARAEDLLAPQTVPGGPTTHDAATSLSQAGHAVDSRKRTHAKAFEPPEGASSAPAASRPAAPAKNLPHRAVSEQRTSPSQGRPATTPRLISKQESCPVGSPLQSAPMQEPRHAGADGGVLESLEKFKQYRQHLQHSMEEAPSAEAAADVVGPSLANLVDTCIPAAKQPATGIDRSAPVQRAGPGDRSPVPRSAQVTHLARPPPAALSNRSQDSDPASEPAASHPHHSHSDGSAKAACVQLERLLPQLSRTKDSIGKATQVGLAAARVGAAAPVLRLILDQMDSTSKAHRRVDLLYLIDSMLQVSLRGVRPDSLPGGEAGPAISRVVSAALPRLMALLTQEAEACQKLSKVLHIWSERRLLPETIMKAALQQLDKTPSSAPTGSQASAPTLNDASVNGAGQVFRAAGGVEVELLLNDEDSGFEDADAEWEREARQAEGRPAGIPPWESDKTAGVVPPPWPTTWQSPSDTVGGAVSSAPGSPWHEAGPRHAGQAGAAPRPPPSWPASHLPPAQPLQAVRNQADVDFGLPPGLQSPLDSAAPHAASGRNQPWPSATASPSLPWAQGTQAALHRQGLASNGNPVSSLAHGRRGSSDYAANDGCGAPAAPAIRHSLGSQLTQQFAAPMPWGAALHAQASPVFTSAEHVARSQSSRRAYQGMTAAPLPTASAHGATQFSSQISSQWPDGAEGASSVEEAPPLPASPGPPPLPNSPIAPGQLAALRVQDDEAPPPLPSDAPPPLPEDVPPLADYGLPPSLPPSRWQQGGSPEHQYW